MSSSGNGHVDERWPPRPRLSRRFYKAHGLGNDYLVVEEGDEWEATREAVARVCHPHLGIGSDGLVALLRDQGDGVHRARMFNPDGGEFERSGNGLRVLGSYLVRRGDSSPARVSVGGGEVEMTLLARAGGRYELKVDLGSARVGAEAVALDPGALDADRRLTGPRGERLRVVPVSVGNPHLVVLGVDLDETTLAEIGAHLVAHPSLRHGANVQLAAPAGAGSCRALIWERGVGPTTASGTSASAVAAALVHEGLLEPGTITVEMPGGSLRVDVGPTLEVVLRGSVEEICEGEMSEALFEV